MSGYSTTPGRRDGGAAVPRALAARVVTAVARQGRSLNDAVTVHRADPRLAPRDRGLLQEISYGVVRWYWRLQALVEEMLDAPSRLKDAEVSALILVGLYQLGHMRIPAHAAVAETVRAADLLGRSWSKGLVNAMLRRYQREGEALERRLDDRGDAVATSHPAWLLRRLKAVWPDHWQRIVAGNNARPPMTLRVNLRRQDRARYVEELRAVGIAADADSRAPAAVVLEDPVPVELLPGFADGRVSVQDIAAQWVLPLMELGPSQRVLDACAAPGGKMAHMLEAEPGLQELVAVEADPSRAGLVRETLHRLGAHATVITADAALPDSWWDGRPFDRILLDAPCTGTGVIRRHPDIKLNRRPTDVESLGLAQGQLLDALWPLLAGSGQLVYVTCSVLPEENDEQVRAFLARHPEAITMRASVPAAVDRVVGSQTLPGVHDADGFYFSVLRRR